MCVRKSIICMLMVVIVASNALRAEEEEGKTLFSGDLKHGVYGGLIVKVGQANKALGVFIGGKGGWVINHRLVIGAKGYVLVNDVEVEGLQNIKLENANWGGLIEYLFPSKSAFHLGLEGMIGAGSVRYSVLDWREDHSDVNYTEDAYFVFEPGINGIIKVLKYLRIGVGVTYRFVAGVDYENLSNSDLFGVSGQIFIKFGKF